MLFRQKFRWVSSEAIFDPDNISWSFDTGTLKSSYYVVHYSSVCIARLQYSYGNIRFSIIDAM
jgi:hypothetical protein